MTARTPIEVVAVVDSAERPGMVAAAEQLSEVLCAVSGEKFWPVNLNIVPPDGRIGASATPTAVIVSLLPDAHRVDRSLAQTEAHWRACLERMKLSGAPVFVCTVFRHVPDRPRDGKTSPLLERIRQLNRLVVDLSHDLDVTVIDIDRALAYCGGTDLKTDYRLRGGAAAEVVGHAVVWSLLSFGLDAIIDPDLQEKAKNLQGDLRQIKPLFDRRMARRRRLAAAAKQVAGE